MVQFKKMPIFQLEGGKDIKFSASLTSRGQAIVCTFSCDQIVGTTVTAEFKPEIKPNYKFPAKKQVAVEQTTIGQALAKQGMKSPIVLSSESMEDEYGSVDCMF